MCVFSPGARPCGGSAMREIVTAPNATTSAWVAKGNAVPTAKSSAPIGGPASWLTVMKPVWSRALAIARSSRSTSMGSSVCEELSANTSAVPSTKRETRTTTIDTRSVTTASARSIRTTARTTSTVTTMRRRSSLSVRAPANNPNINGGNHWTVAASATIAGLLVSEATTSGPAAIAMPSPRLLTHDDASSHRKPVPRRAGATVSTSRLTTARWYPSGARRTRSFERGAADLRATQRRGGQARPHEARAGDRRIDEAGSRQLGVIERGGRDGGSVERGRVELGAAQIERRERRTGQVNSNEVRIGVVAREREAREITSGQVRSFQRRRAGDGARARRCIWRGG